MRAAKRDCWGSVAVSGVAYWVSGMAAMVGLSLLLHQAADWSAGHGHLVNRADFVRARARLPPIRCCLPIGWRRGVSRSGRVSRPRARDQGHADRARDGEVRGREQACTRQERWSRADQLRAARALVDWSREDLAERSNVSPNTVWGFEQGRSDPKLSTLNKWQRALESAGVQFIDDGAKSDAGLGPGVRLFRGAKAKR
jgi:ribosome-binding protein aMBF1 (putative translation factor)